MIEPTALHMMLGVLTGWLDRREREAVRSHPWITSLRSVSRHEFSLRSQLHKINRINRV